MKVYTLVYIVLNIKYYTYKLDGWIHSQITMNIIIDKFQPRDFYPSVCIQPIKIVTLLGSIITQTIKIKKNQWTNKMATRF